MSARRVLLPFDGTDARDAIEYARRVGSVMNADLFPLHVTTGPRRATVHLHRAEITVRAGDPAEEIVRFADDIDADLIVMPARRFGVLGQLLLGSTTMDVIRKTRRSVWIASRRSLKRQALFSCRRIVCGIDINQEALPVLKCACDFAARLNADVMVVHASPWINDATAIGCGPEVAYGGALPPRMYLRRLLKMMRRNLPLPLEVTTGDVAEVLREAARQYSADLVVIGRGIHTSQWQFGANIGDIVSRVDCAVLTCDGRRSNADLEFGPFGDLSFLSDT